MYEWNSINKKSVFQNKNNEINYVILIIKNTTKKKTCENEIQNQNT